MNLLLAPGGVEIESSTVTPGQMAARRNSRNAEKQ
jgi:hypothetical protein